MGPLEGMLVEGGRERPQDHKWKTVDEILNVKPILDM